MKFSDVAHLYKECKILHGDFTATVQYVMRYGVKADYDVDNSRFDAQFDKIKPILKPKHKFTIEDFADICKVIFGTDKVIYAVVGGYYAVTTIDEKDDDEENSLGENLSERTKQIIINAEEIDHENVLSITEPKENHCQLDLANGTSDELRYFVGIDVQAVFTIELCKKGYDIFDLIKSGEAIEYNEELIATKYK